MEVGSVVRDDELVWLCTCGAENDDGVVSCRLCHGKRDTAKGDLK